MISTNTSEDGLFLNSIASCTSTGNLNFHTEPSSNYNNNNNNNNIANFFSQELADDQPAAALIGTNSADFVEDHHTINNNGHQSCWTDFLMDMDLWNLDHGN